MSLTLTVAVTRTSAAVEEAAGREQQQFSGEEAAERAALLARIAAVDNQRAELKQQRLAAEQQAAEQAAASEHERLATLSQTVEQVTAAVTLRLNPNSAVRVIQHDGRHSNPNTPVRVILELPGGGASQIEVDVWCEREQDICNGSPVSHSQSRIGQARQPLRGMDGQPLSKAVWNTRDDVRRLMETAEAYQHEAYQLSGAAT